MLEKFCHIIFHCPLPSTLGRISTLDTFQFKKIVASQYIFDARLRYFF
jgi:hypothetical protein